MDKGKRTGGSKPHQTTVVIRLLAGGYLVYLAYDLFKVYISPTEGGLLYQLGCAAFFFAVGAGLVIWSGLKFVKGDYVKNGVNADADTSGDAVLEEDGHEEKQCQAAQSDADDTEKISTNQEDDENDRS